MDTGMVSLRLINIAIGTIIFLFATYFIGMPMIDRLLNSEGWLFTWLLITTSGFFISMIWLFIEIVKVPLYGLYDQFTRRSENG